MQKKGPFAEPFSFIRAECRCSLFRSLRVRHFLLVFCWLPGRIRIEDLHRFRFRLRLFPEVLLVHDPVRANGESHHS